IVIWNATQKCDSSILNSNDFIDKNSYLLDSSLWKQYYSPTLMFSSDAKRDFIDPDLKPISINNSHITN
ncbi:unnamed protein product, partial [Rotaria sp. Silwood1]